VLELSTSPWRRIGEWRHRSTHSVTSALDGGEWLTSRPYRFTPRERAPGTHYVGGWVGPRAVLDAVVKRKIPIPRRKSDPRTPTVQPLAQRYTDWAITALTAKLVAGVEWPGRKTVHSPPFSAEIKNASSYTSTPPINVHEALLRWAQEQLNLT
jgi:hypothetical protein